MKLTTALALLLTLASATAQVRAGLATTVTVTAYCACPKCCGKWSVPDGPAKTASGAIPREGVTCAASRKIPFGTRLQIEGVGVRTVQDRLAARYDDRVDVFFTDHRQALRFGKRTLRVQVLP